MKQGPLGALFKSLVPLNGYGHGVPYKVFTELTLGSQSFGTNPYFPELRASLTT